MLFPLCLDRSLSFLYSSSDKPYGVSCKLIFQKCWNSLGKKEGKHQNEVVMSTWQDYGWALFPFISQLAIENYIFFFNDQKWKRTLFKGEKKKKGHQISDNQVANRCSWDSHCAPSTNQLQDWRLNSRFLPDTIREWFPTAFEPTPLTSHNNCFHNWSLQNVKKTFFFFSKRILDVDLLLMKTTLVWVFLEFCKGVCVFKIFLLSLQNDLIK